MRHTDTEFSDDTELIADLDNYSDALHYAEWVNEYILQSMYTGDHRLEKECYNEFYDGLETFYEIYDYDAVLE